MKLKLFLISIFIFLSLVGYQKYAEISALKSIDSYESCVSATGSTIQESYPATCVTRLGKRYTEPTPMPVMNTSDWKTYTHPKYSFTFQYPPDWKVVEDYNPQPHVRSKYTETGGELMLSLYKDGNSLRQIYISPELPVILRGEQLSSVKIANLGGKTVLVYEKEQSRHYFYLGKADLPHFWIEQYYPDQISYKILSTFKFTD